ncbi:MAG: hypothetical protein B7Z14_15700, partial [Bosea sp. 32-68-6]
MAGLSYQLSASGRGLEITLAGYQHKLPVLLERLLQQMQDSQLSDDDFDRYRASLQRTLENQ